MGKITKTYTLDEELVERLRVFCKDEGRTMQGYINYLLKIHLPEVPKAQEVPTLKVQEVPKVPEKPKVFKTPVIPEVKPTRIEDIELDQGLIDEVTKYYQSFNGADKLIADTLQKAREKKAVKLGIN